METAWLKPLDTFFPAKGPLGVCLIGSYIESMAGMFQM